jgi:hypothetical protein
VIELDQTNWRTGSSSAIDGVESEVREKARDLWVVLPREVVETAPGCSNHALEQLSKFAKSINYKIGSFAQQLRSVKTCGETHGKAPRVSSCNDTIERVFDDPAVSGWKFQPGNCFQEDFR